MTKNFPEQVAVGDGKTQECAQKLFRDNVVDKLAAKVASSDAYLQEGVNLASASSKGSQAIEDDYRQVARQIKSFQPATTTANEGHVGLLDGREKEEEREHGQDKPVQVEKRESMENILGIKSSRDATRKQNTLRSESLAFSRRVHEVQGSAVTNYKLKHLKSVQLPFVLDKVNGFSAESQNTEKVNDFVNLEQSHNTEKAKEIDSLEHAHNNAIGNAATKENKPSNGVSGESQNTDKARDFDNLEQSQNTEKAKEIDNLDHAHSNPVGNAAIEENKPSNGFSDSKFEWKSRIDMLEEELREAAVVESALYSVVAEHGSSTNKVHAPARRLSRFYLHACKAESDAKRASAARAAVSGLILVSKSCGSDVPRLTFWLSNSIMLRGIVNQAVKKTPLPEGPNMETNVSGKGSGGRYSLEWNKLSSTEKETNQLIQELGNWENPQIFTIALEKIEAWIFARIVESVWWQTLTPHMQSTAAKSSGIGSSSRRHKHALGDQEQGSFSIELWKKAFKDACERLCPIRAGGHECGCLPLLARLVYLCSSTRRTLLGLSDAKLFSQT